jgi:hypothetical protein
MTGFANSRSIIMELPVSTNAATPSAHRRALVLAAAVVLCTSLSTARTAATQGSAGTARDSAAMTGAGAMESMSTAMDGGLMNAPHMRMTTLTRPAPGDSARAATVLAALRSGIAPYSDFHRALADGFHIFAPRIPQRVYHFTSTRNGLAAMIHFNPASPTSLLYERTGDSSYRLVGAMYTAPRWESLSVLNARIPLSVAEWHVHTNWCLPKRAGAGRLGEKGPDGRPLFGGHGSITTKEACDAANGRFVKQAFGWMVHVYPTATDPAAIWGRDAMHEMAGNHED